MDEKAQKNPFQETLNLPKTDFSIRANAQVKEPELLQRWEEENINHLVTIKNSGKQKFVLHFGPPYANGHLHIGHSLSETLKDITCKSKRMAGFHVPLVPGWDCHGLPIELKVTTEMATSLRDGTSVPPQGERDGALARIAFKKRCREYAQRWVDIQKNELKEHAILADYQHAYVTMDPGYEASVLEAFAMFIEKGHIERKLKTVPWCGSCQTVLATAEIEYKDRKDPSIYVLFPYPDDMARMTFPFLFEKKPNLKLNFVLWTTTPWSVPLNRAVVLNPTATYSVLQGRDENEAIIVVQDLADKVCQAVGLTKIELAEADAVVFSGKKAAHAFVQDLLVPILLDESVTATDGTGCMSLAPGCGPEDYLLGVKNGLEIFSPLSADGKYIKGIMPTTLEGMPITDGQWAVLKMLQEKNTLLYKTSITHSYPHCWRCHNGLMFRATSQWFCDLQKHKLVERTLTQIEKIAFIPERGQARLKSFIGNRTEWCISRQRQWGTPIPALLCNDCGHAFLDAHFVRAVAERVSTEGIEFWDRMTPEKLAQEKLLSTNFACASCKNSNLEKFTLERDILDVWFDSGASSYAVLAKDPKNLGVPADMYFEGSDQHRGWFQSSLLCGMVLYDHAPMKTITTHGFVLDEQKRKMSKSLGNVVAPGDVMTKYSRDILRLWVASANFEDDLVISDKLLQNVAEMYRKIRNTCRYMIANLSDFDISKDAIDIEQLFTLDQYALAKLFELNEKVRKDYAHYNFAAVVHAINNYCTNDLSAVYLDILKDRLYVEKPESRERRSAQTVLYHTLDVITRLLAPVLSFLAEEISDFYQKDKQQSMHLQDFTQPVDVWGYRADRIQPNLVPAHVIAHDTQAASYIMQKQGQWIVLEQLRDVVLKAIEVKRVAGMIKHPYEAQVTIYLDGTSSEGSSLMLFIKELQLKENVERFFKDWFIVSNVIFVDNKTNLDETAFSWVAVAVQHADGVKCPRCWQWEVSTHKDHLCHRCSQVLGQ